MPHRGIRFVHAAVLVFSVVLSFLLLRQLDEGEMLGNSALVQVVDTDDSTTGSQVIRAVELLSAEMQVGVAREISDLKDPDRVRHLYVAAGDSESRTATWLANGYPAFSSRYETRIHPISDLGQRDPRGQYYVFGPAEAGNALMAKFSDLGLTATISHPLSYEELAGKYSDDPLFWALCVVALAAVTTTGASVLLSAKAYGVLRLQGVSLIGVVLRDLRQLRFFWLMSLGILATASLFFLGLYNGFAWFGLLVIVTAVIATLLTLVVLATHLAVIGMIFKLEILPSLKGELPSRTATIGVYLVRIPALLLALAVAANVTLASRDVATRQENQDAYSSLGDAVSIRLSGAFAMHLDELNGRVGPWLREADRRGEIVVVGRRDLQLSVSNVHLPAGEILIVNDTYLAEQEVFDLKGRRYTSEGATNKAPDSRTVRVIVPESLSSHTSSISKAADEIINPSGKNQKIPFEAHISKTGQHLFGYNSGALTYSSSFSPDQDRSLVRDPVLVVVPNGSHFLTNDGYTSFASQEAVVFNDPDDVSKALKSEGLHPYITAISPVGQKNALEYRNVSYKLRVQTFNLAVAAIVLLVAGVGVCLIYARKNAQSIFVRHISGWCYASNHRFILAVETSIAFVFATRVPFEAWQQRQELKELASAGTPAPFEPTHITALDAAMIAGLVAFEFGVVLLALAFFHRRIVRGKVSEV
ncbi:hypothetical protein [Streptomyces griseus]|uniref:hypothetical protein n=1 Tax=Streptomyces griseus TaxID=1911 RepID=UPI003409DEF3